MLMKNKKYTIDCERIKVFIAVAMLITGILFILYPVAAKRCNEYIALKTNAEYVSQYEANYNSDGEIVIIP